MSAQTDLSLPEANIRNQNFLEIAVVIVLLATGTVLALMTQSQIVGALFLSATIGFIWLMLRRRQSNWAEFGLKAPESWLKTIVWALLIAAGFAVGVVLVMFLIFSVGAVPPPDLSRFAELQGNLPMLLLFVATIWVTAALFEELIFRGFLMNRLAESFGGTDRAWRISLVIHAVIFGLIHYYQGPTGMVITGLTGLILGALYLHRKRNLWNTIFLHGFINTTSMLLFYFGVHELFV